MRKLFASLFFVALIATGVQARAAVGSLWVFSDSLSDSGNIFIATGFATEPFPHTNLVPSRAYPSATLSDGEVWVQLLAGSLGLDLAPSLAGDTTYSFGGAVTGALSASGVSPGLFAGEAFPPSSECHAGQTRLIVRVRLERCRAQRR